MIKQLFTYVSKLRLGNKEEYRNRRSPTPEMVLMVEKFLEKNNGTYKKNQLRKQLPKTLMQSTLNFILDYLEDMYKIQYNVQDYVFYIG